MSTGDGQETYGYRLMRVEQRVDKRDEEMKELSDRIDKLTLAIVSFALTLAVFGLGIAITLLTTRG